MIKKIDSIKRLAVYKDFNWDTEVKKPDGSTEELGHLNILYGQNYSGKTTLSRLLRALETKELSSKYGYPEFKISIDDDTEINHSNFKEQNLLIRVFNEDFIRDNLKFITNPDANVEPFAIIGGDNVKLAREIELLEKEIGSSESDPPTGLEAKLAAAIDHYNSAEDDYNNIRETLDKQIREKAIGRQNGIKYKSQKFGDQNYSQTKLHNEIGLVLSKQFEAQTDSEISTFENLISESVIETSTPNLPTISTEIIELSNQAKNLIIRKVADSDKIERLVKDAILHRWVQEGRKHHESSNESCIFCGNHIEESRWLELDKHFDKESEKLEESIESLITRITIEEERISAGLVIDKSNFYSKFHSRLDQLCTDYKTVSNQYTESLKALKEQLISRRNDIANPHNFYAVVDPSESLESLCREYETICAQSNSFTERLEKEQSNAKKHLRLQEVANFISDINYEEQIKKLETPEKKMDQYEKEKKYLLASVSDKKEAIKAKKKEMHDEAKGAKKVNEYLTNFFGHNFLSLEAKRYTGDAFMDDFVSFEVIRGDRKAYHLSEGECRLLAFCYFLAKLDDTETKGTKPILWIDDPISSLDSNHIFFIYSLLLEEVVSKNKFEQLFISTHSLDFLKYLKRLNGEFSNPNPNKNPISYSKKFFIIDRRWDKSSITVMPNYLKNYVTEFNYLFDQIYKCSKIETVNDENYATLYNFPNNARKFLEIYLFYKFPHGDLDRSGKIYATNMSKFFGDRPIPAALTSRISNEYSHLSGGLERGATPIDVPEMKETAASIIDSLKADPDQFEAFLSSIGEAVTAEELVTED